MTGKALLGIPDQCVHLQAVNSADGTLLDQFTLTKPANWTTNYNRQSATMKTFVGGL